MQLIGRFFVLLFITLTPAFSQKPQILHLASPDGALQLTVDLSATLQWSVRHKGQVLLAPSPISLRLQNGEKLGQGMRVISAKTSAVNEKIRPLHYKKDTIVNSYNQLIVSCQGDYGIIFRAYNKSAAYRFFTSRKDSLIIQSEQAEFKFDQDYTAYIPYTSGLRDGERYSCSFEEFYTETALSKMNKDTLGYLPLLVQLANNKKVVLLEADAQNYPGMFVQHNSTNGLGVNAVFAPYPLEEKLGDDKGWDHMVTKRADYIARVNGTRQFPWRVLIVSEEDKELLNNDIVQCLAEPGKIVNTAWIKPGKVAWDWWNDNNVTNVDFKAGINTQTYKYYIDFAAANHLEYVILDEGWSDVWDMTKLKQVVDLQALVDYGKQKNVGLILWCTKYALSRDMDGLCRRYSLMGVKGFKIDFLDRNDQKMVNFCYQIASVAASYQLLLDLHGVFPPQGLQRTWPNVVNFEAVRGMENMKWSADERVPRHDVNLLFVRMLAGPMDYTPGAMRNATKGEAKISNSLPMSMGTRGHQIAMYVLYEAPLQMLADSPTAYLKDQACTDFIDAIPTTFNETIALDGQLGEYAILARRKKDVWYVGGMTNWTGRDITLDCSFLKKGRFSAELIRDGLNANRDATDYKKEVLLVDGTQKLPIHVAPGGGFAIRFTPTN